MVAHQVGKAMEEAASGSRRTYAASRVVKPTGEDYKHTFLEPRAQNLMSPGCPKVLSRSLSGTRRADPQSATRNRHPVRLSHAECRPRRTTSVFINPESEIL